MDTQDSREPVRDYRADHGNVEEDDITGHHTDRWQQHAMYVGLHLPKSSGKHGHRRRRKRRPGDHTIPSDQDTSHKPHSHSNGVIPLANGYAPPATPPSQRVQFLLGREEDGEEVETHDVFCEMDTLRHGEDGDMEWKETARWIKFEEDVEEGGERWSKPHVATLSLHSLFELRKGIMSGTVMLDVDATTRVQIIELVVDSLIASKQMDAEHKEKVQDVLLARHRHQHQRKHEKSKGLPLIRSLADIGRKSSEKKLENKDGLTKSGSAGHLTPGGMGRRNSSKDLEENSDLHETPSQIKFNEHFLKKIPPGAEASNILVGEVDFLTHPILAFVRLNKATLLGDLTEVPVPTRFIFFLLGPTGNQTRYNEIGRSIATLMSDEVFHDVAYKARGRNDLLSGIDEFLDQVTVLPPGEWDPTIRIEPPKSIPSQEGRKKADPGGKSNGMPSSLVLKELSEMEEPADHTDPTLERTGRFFGGLIADVKRKLPWYWSDVKDAFHIQCLASFFFMYFACLTPIITFGGLLASATDRWIAAMESLVSGAICGVTYHLFSGQPLTIIGSTGPVLVFETIVFEFCKDNGLDYLAFRFWIGIWMSAILLVMVMFDLSALVKYITRFTEESFAMLIALIFIVEAFKKLVHIMDHYAVNLDGEYGVDYDCVCWPQSLYHDLTNTTKDDFKDGDYAKNASMPLLLPGVRPENDTSNDTAVYSDVYSHIQKYNYDEKYCKENQGYSIGSECHIPPYSPDVFFFCVILFIGTYIISMGLKFFRNTRFLPNKVRVLVSDFAVFTAILVMVGVDLALGLPTPKLEVPEEFRPTRFDRGWFINPFTNPLWCIPAAILPSLLATILIFMDQQITAVIVNRKENKLLKGSGYHLDLFLIAIQIAVCSMLGTPWFVAATVLSINHVRSLTRESETAAPGERPKFLGVREQRVTGTVVFMMVGLSALMSTVLKRIPMAVLFGVFLFMGTSSLKGIQLMQRVLIIFMPSKYQPDYVYLRQVPLRRVHLFTAFQIGCLVILWVIKSFKKVSIIFPLMVLSMCFVRKGLDWVFTRHELKWLDDIIPESHKREKEEKKKKIIEAEEVIEMSGGAVNIPLKDGKSIKIPVDRITYDPHSNQVNISDEMSSTAIWKQLAANESNPNLQDYDLRKRKHKHRSHKKSKEDSPPSEPVKFNIADDNEETDALMPSPPQIVVTREVSPRGSKTDVNT